jgi:hypothetical protein
MGNGLMENQSITSNRKIRKPITGDVLAKVVELADKGLTQQEIGDLVGADNTTICKVLKRYNLSNEAIIDYTNHRLSIIRGKQDEVLKCIKPEHFKKMSGLQLATVWGIMIDKEQALLGNNASNKPVINIIIGNPAESSSTPVTIDVTGNTDDNQ